MYTEGLLLALKMTDDSLFNTATRPSTTVLDENSCGLSLMSVDRAAFRTGSGFKRESFSCFIAPHNILTALASFPEDNASLMAGRSSPERTVGV